MLFHPSIEVNSIESDARLSEWDLGEVRPDVALEQRLAHTEIGRRLRGAQQARQQDRVHSLATLDRLPVSIDGVCTGHPTCFPARPRRLLVVQPASRSTQ